MNDRFLSTRLVRSYVVRTGAVAALAVGLLSGTGVAATLTVSGLSDIYYAGTANTYAPAEVTGFSLTPGNTLNFSATGATDYGGCTGSDPDSGNCGSGTIGSANGLSAFTGSFNSLIGVFIDANVPGGVAPASYTVLTTDTSFAPGLNQVFFIGDGLTGTGSGSTQSFLIPTGATRLFLGTTDAAFGTYNNSGQFEVSVTEIVNESTATPEPTTSILVSSALGAAFALRKKWFCR